MIATLSAATGLPLHVLDPRAPLSLDDVRAFFESRVLGQPEAVECLVDRVALVKAGLTDPTRPLGVFLFVGPTGTGKTEIAKAFSEFLFGSPDRLVRLDMSEFQTPESLERLLGDSAEGESAAPLISSVRKQPFTVLLLDEFEKAHQNVWDVFLQVFDDGRLTDRNGRTVDLRHCVIILTSNLGSAIPRGPGVGFTGRSGEFDPATVTKSVEQSFRPEFLNRLDRVVVFRPLGREIMRGLLEKELNDVLERRGFRMHPWAVEWDEAAIDFLIEQGFSAELGARPLKRAVERYLLTRIATAIVERQFPEGDQFLFITARDGTGLDVAFVDPNAGEPESATAAEEPVDPGGLTVARVALEPDGTEAEADLPPERARLARRARTLMGRRQGGRAGGGARAGLLAVRGSTERAEPDRVPRSPGGRDGDGRTAWCAPLLRARGPFDRAAPPARDAPARAHGRARRSRCARGERRDAHGPGGQVRGCGRLRSVRARARDDVRRLGRRPWDADSQKRRRTASSSSTSPGLAPTRC